MQSFMDIVAKVNGAVNSVVWGVPMLILIIFTGIFISVKTGFFQVTKFKTWMDETLFAIFKKKHVTKTSDKKAISQFQALSTALAATIGTGNIAGVATGVCIGGPGAVFWMWVSAFFGMMTSFAENVLGIYFRKKNEDGEWSGGAMYYIEEGLKDKKILKHIAKPLAVLFAIFCVLASFGIGNMAQMNSISSAMKSNFNIPAIITGVVLAIVAALVILGGIKRVASVTEKLVPFMAIFYIVSCLIIFVMNFRYIPYVFSSIFKSAFSFSAVAGGVGGYVIKRAVTMGFKRGVFSNEAGLGSSVMVNCASDVKEPVIQGMWGIFAVFFDTIIICTLTAFVILSSPANSLTFDEAMNSISTKSQYFAIHTPDEGDTLNLIDSNINPMLVVADDKAEEGTYTEYPAKTIYGQEFTVKIMNTDTVSDEDDFTFANVMEITGIQAKDSNGNALTDENGNPVISSVKISEVNGVPLVTYAFSQRLGSASGKILAIAILLFAFSTTLGWSFYGTKALEYLLGIKATYVYKVIFVLFIIVGSTMNLGLAWNISDTFNGLMAIPNLIAVLSLSGIVFSITRNYIHRCIKKDDPDAVPLLSAYSDIQAEQCEKLNK